MQCLALVSFDMGWLGAHASTLSATCALRVAGIEPIVATLLSTISPSSAVQLSLLRVCQPQRHCVNCDMGGSWQEANVICKPLRY
ncbi:hypothetical protein B0H67DRAFT_568166 [Lasiosphaeris hirsuta]|uniref:Uncharacterized protein n=1 Tax=Lasiosphaeris hirsuta TaxID=260670 RepID=A0AA40AYY3_9PEZI|nr:hypothetical protein B0H67DRAFT_568166 [Lasiosphaeris hirsuta]